MIDLIVIGAGPAGLTAALFAKRFGLDCIVFDNPEQLSQITYATEIENYPGFNNISGMELLEKMKQQVKNLKVQIKDDKVLDFKKQTDKFILTIEKKQYQTKSIIIATGSQHRKAEIPGEAEFLGKGVSYCGTCDGPLFKGKDVIVWGGGDSALSTAIYLNKIKCNVTLVHRRTELRGAKILEEKARKQGVKFVLGRTIKKISGGKFLEKVILDNDDEIKCSAIFITIGEVPTVELAKKIGIGTDENNFIIVDALQQTNVEGIFAAGDVTITPLRQIVTACGDGAKAALAAYKYLQDKKK